MKEFVNNVINELKNDPELNDNSLVNLVIESTDKSINSNDRYDSIYIQLKSSLVGINEHLKNNKLSNILDQFKKSEITNDSILDKMSKRAGLSDQLTLIKETTAYSNPLILEKVNRYESLILKGQPEYQIYPTFISEMKIHLVEDSVKRSVEHVRSVLESNANDFEVLHAIKLMESFNSPIYSSIVSNLKQMLVEGTYSADIISLKFGETNLPYVNTLVNNLRIVEARATGGFTLGAGDADTQISNLIAPAKQTKSGLITYMDNRFIKISEGKKSSNGDLETHINEAFTISTVKPEWVLKNHSDLYKTSEIFANLGFTQSGIREGVESNSIRNFAINLNTNEKGNLDVYINGSNVGDTKSVNLTEALAMETDSVRENVEYLFNNISNLYTFEFIKNITNFRTLAEASVIELDGNYVICNKKNAAEREWNKVNEKEMYDFFNENFNYDISVIYGTQINEHLENTKAIEIAKSKIKEDISKLEGSVSKINESINSNSVEATDVAKLEELKGSIEDSISKLKEEYINVDLTKKKLNENEDKKEAYCQKEFNCAYDKCNDEQKKKCDAEYDKESM